MILKSFKPIVDQRSRILILGSMPGPQALRKRQYYGFSGNHFWKILPDLLGEPRPLTYREKVKLLKENQIALWDVVGSCTRKGASDGSIQNVKPNNVARLIRKYRKVRAIFLNGRTAEKLFKKYFSPLVEIRAHYLPSTSPAHASLSYTGKLRKWSVIKNA